MLFQFFQLIFSVVELLENLSREFTKCVASCQLQKTSLFGTIKIVCTKSKIFLVTYLLPNKIYLKNGITNVFDVLKNKKSHSLVQCTVFKNPHSQLLQ